jgi:hypothetical protein
LRLQLGQDVDLREAYLDLALLNVYCGVGVVDLLIDDLELQGHVPVKQAQEITPAVDVEQAQFQAPQTPAADAQSIEMRGSVLMVGGRPLFPRVVDHRGESFEFLKRIGFNAVRLAAPPTPWQITEARRHEMWLVAPPPDVRAGRSIGPSHDRVLAWDLGRRLDARQLATVRDLAFAVRRADEQTGRPLLAQAEEQLRSYSRITNVMALHREPLHTSFDLADYGPWLQAQRQLLRPGTPTWATIQSEPPAGWLEHAAVDGLPHSASVDPQQIRLLTLSAVAAGARGLMFSSRARLDGNDPAALERAQALELVNRELDLIEPWLAVGTHANALQVAEENVAASMFSSQQSHLILLTQIARHSQFVMAPPRVQRMSLIVPGVPESSDAYLLSPTGIRPLSHRRVTGGIGVAIEDLSWASAVVFTSDPLVYARLAKTAAAHRTRVAQLQLGATVSLLRETKPQLAQSATSPSATGELTTALALIDANLSQGQRMLTAGDAQAASVYSNRAAVSLAQLRRNMWEQSTSGNRIFTSPVESMLPTTARSAAESERFGPSQLAAGNMEDLTRLKQTGWRNFRREQHGISSDVELSPVSPNTGQFSLRLEATRVGEQATAHVEQPPVWIQSPGVAVRAGQHYEIHGWVRVNRPLAGTFDGVLIHDTLQGRELAIRVYQTSGWQPFRLQGVAMRDQQLAVNIELTGLGEAFIDDVEIVAPGADTPPPKATAPSTASRLRDLIRLPR